MKSRKKLLVLSRTWKMVRNRPRLPDRIMPLKEERWRKLRR
jgi:hypothetical protein